MRSILGESKAVQDLIKMIHRVASSKTNVLILGESGTGKELTARMIHDSGPLKNNPFIPVNCGAIPENLIETEMFGHHKGSFTGAVSDKVGLFEAANKGTLFLDEVGELPLSMQVKLLRAIQERVIRKVGGIQDISTDVRIIAATNRDLESEVKKGKFREDLYYRLNVILLRTPPLRARKGDVQLLAQSFLKKFATRSNKDISDFDPAVLAALDAYSWPGNVRELENCIERAVTMETGNQLTLASFPVEIQNVQISNSSTSMSDSGGEAGERNHIAKDIHLPGPNFSSGKIDLDQILGEVEKTYLLAAIEKAGGVKKKASDILGITLRSLRYRIKKLNLTQFDDAE